MSFINIYMTARYVYQQFNYGKRITRMVQIFADLFYMTVRNSYQQSK